MNVDFFDLNNNKYAVSDDNYNIKIIESNGDKDNILEILSYENDLENFASKIQINENLIMFLERNEFLRRCSNNVLITASIVALALFCCFSNTLIFVITLSSLLFIKGCMLSCYGTKKSNDKKLSSARRDRYNLTSEFVKLKNKIKVMKDNINFQIVEDKESCYYVEDNYYDLMVSNNSFEIKSKEVNYNLNPKRKIRKRYNGIKQ